jgi:hypothetical protein
MKSSKVVPVDSASLEGSSSEAQDSHIPAIIIHEDDEFLKKWSGPMVLGPFSLAIFAIIVIVSGEIVLNTWTGSCGYSLNCKLPN